jgi:hypothetical protein
MYGSYEPDTLGDVERTELPGFIGRDAKRTSGAVNRRGPGGQPVQLESRNAPDPLDLDIDAFADSIQKLAASMGQMPVVLAAAGSRMMLGVHSRSGDAEQRVAEALGVDLMTVSVASSYLYRLTASEELDRRAGTDATPQMRDRIALEIRCELRRILDGDD